VDFVVIFGPPAVGKMTVGDELCQITGFKLLHNHMTIEPVLGIFPFGSPPFGRLVDEFRLRIIEEAVKEELAGLVFTFVWGLDLPEDLVLMQTYLDLVEAGGGRACFVELLAEQEVRLKRNETPLRLARKPSRRDIESSRRQLLELDDGYVLNTSEGSTTIAHELLERNGWLRIDNTSLEPVVVAKVIAGHFEHPSRKG
jgi:hypothetical protein